jgi:hypothetical protein
MPLTTEQLREALGLVDTMISCKARLEADIQDDRWRAHLESSIATCSEQIQAYLNSADPSPRRERNDILPGAASAGSATRAFHLEPGEKRLS